MHLVERRFFALIERKAFPVGQKSEEAGFFFGALRGRIEPALGEHNVRWIVTVVELQLIFDFWVHGLDYNDDSVL